MRPRRKLTLNLDALTVQSFEIYAGRSAPFGTVHARQNESSSEKKPGEEPTGRARCPTDPCSELEGCTHSLDQAQIA